MKQFLLPNVEIEYITEQNDPILPRALLVKSSSMELNRMVINELHSSLAGRSSYLGRLRDSKVKLAELLSAGKYHASIERVKGLRRNTRTEVKDLT